jgi:hypothetical protein
VHWTHLRAPFQSNSFILLENIQFSSEVVQYRYSKNLLYTLD